MSTSLGLVLAIWLLTALITRGWIKLAKARLILDTPERRRLHLAPVPRAGGIGIAVVMMFASLFVYLVLSNGDPVWIVIIVAIVIFSVLGFRDDLKPMPPGRKLLLHLIAVTIVFLVSLLLTSSGWLVSLVTALSYLMFVNVWNFMDGSNGMVGMQSLLFAVGFLLLGYFSSGSYYYGLILATCCLGFLPFNFPVAHVFLGDVGSHVLGAAVVGLALLAYTEGQWSFTEIMCLFSGLWIDAVLTLLRRCVRGYKVTQPHRSHLYQYAIRLGYSHVALCVCYAAWTSGIIILVGLSRQLAESSQRFLLVAVILLGCVLHQVLRLFVLKSGRTKKKPEPLS